MAKQGRNARARAKQRRDSEKRKRKAVMKARYREWTDKGMNQKSKRVRLAKGRSTALRTRERRRSPGNLGDYKCHPDINMPFFARMLLLERQGHRNQYTSKCSHIQVDAWIQQNNFTL